MTRMPESERFHSGEGVDLGILQDIRQSTQPNIAMLRAADLPIKAFHPNQNSNYEVANFVIAARDVKDWDALSVHRNADGKISVEIHRSNRRPTLQRNLCCFMPSEFDSSFQWHGDNDRFTLYFESGFLRGLLKDDAEESLDLSGGQHLRQVAQLMFLVEGELRRPSLGSRLMIDGLLRAIAALLLVSSDTAPLPVSCARIYLSPPKLKRVIDFIEANLQENIGLDDLAAAAGLSANHFLRVFKLATGVTPYHFLRTRRLERARLLLIGDDMPLAQLALECGFANQSHFTAAFSRELGVSPGRYRRAMRS